MVTSAMDEQQALPKLGSSTRTKDFYRKLGAVTAIALILRLYAGFALQTIDPDVIAPRKGTDMAQYHNLASAITDGTYHPTKQGFYFQPFYYGVFLPAIYTIAGKSSDNVIVCQALIGAGTVWLIGILFAGIAGRQAGFLAAVLLALCRTHVFYTPYRLIAVLQCFWMALICVAA